METIEKKREGEKTKRKGHREVWIKSDKENFFLSAVEDMVSWKSGVMLPSMKTIFKSNLIKMFGVP